MDNDGNVDNHITYDGFGQITSETNTAVDHIFGFTGRDRDEESDLQFNRARYYDAAVGRWVSENRLSFLSGDTNLVRYVSNASAAMRDPHGVVGSSPPFASMTRAEARALMAQEWNRMFREMMGQQFGISNASSMSVGQLMGILEDWHAVHGSSIHRTDPLDHLDQAAAGYADGLTGGLTTWIRRLVYGRTATRNHRGRVFNAARTVGTVQSYVIPGGAQANAGRLARTGQRILRAVDSANDARDVAIGLNDLRRGRLNVNPLQALQRLVGGRRRPNRVTTKKTKTPPKRKETPKTNKSCETKCGANTGRRIGCFIAGTPVLVPSPPGAESNSVMPNKAPGEASADKRPAYLVLALLTGLATTYLYQRGRRRKKQADGRIDAAFSSAGSWWEDELIPTSAGLR